MGPLGYLYHTIVPAIAPRSLVLPRGLDASDIAFIQTSTNSSPNRPPKVMTCIADIRANAPIEQAPMLGP